MDIPQVGYGEVQGLPQSFMSPGPLCPNKPDSGSIQKKKKKNGETSLVIQGLRLSAPNAGRLSSIPDQGTKSHILQLRISMLKPGK